MKILPYLSLAAVLLISGCIATDDINTNFTTPYVSDTGEGTDILTGNPTANCIDLCNAKKNSGFNFSSGPCLSDNNPDWKMEDWVCDTVYEPRQAEIDNLPENQCQEFINGTAHHFVEISINCELIRTR